MTDGDSPTAGRTALPFGEFVVLMAAMFSLVALSIDAMLPALQEMGRDLGVSHVNDAQLILSIMLFGFGAGQLFYGPLSDSSGRKRPIYAGFAVFMVGSLI